MLMSAFRPWLQLPDLSFADVAVSLTRWFRGWGEIGADFARRVHDTLRCAERTAPGLCFRRAWPNANNVLTFSLRRVAAQWNAGFHPTCRDRRPRRSANLRCLNNGAPLPSPLGKVSPDARPVTDEADLRTACAHEPPIRMVRTNLRRGDSRIARPNGARKSPYSVTTSCPAALIMRLYTASPIPSRRGILT